MTEEIATWPESSVTSTSSEPNLFVAPEESDPNHPEPLGTFEYGAVGN